MFKIFINFKTYPQGTGEKAMELARICEGVGVHPEGSPRGGNKGIEIIPVVQVVDLFRIKQAVKIPIWVQHLDCQEQGKFTGLVNLESVIEAGASGTLLNHSEHQIPPGTVKQVLSAVDSRLKAESKFETMVCCKTLGQMERLIKFKPDYLAFEISELIGGEVSVTDTDTKAIKHGVEICQEIPLVVGAGINKAEDLKKAKELGAKGVLISSAVVLAENPKEKLENLVKLVI